jgi:hypothetical protein
MNIFTVILDFTGAIVLLSMMKVITGNFGWHTPEQRWATIRRIYYTVMSIALFAKGAHRLQNIDAEVDYLDIVPQIVIITGIMFFPALRALGYLTQDRLRGPLVEPRRRTSRDY